MKWYGIASFPQIHIRRILLIIVTPSQFAFVNSQAHSSNGYSFFFLFIFDNNVDDFILKICCFMNAHIIRDPIE